MIERARSGRIVIDWVDATDEKTPRGEYNFGWRLAPDPPIDDERMAALLQEIAQANGTEPAM